MEKDLEVAGLKKEKLARNYEIAHAEAKSIVSFTVQWKDLEDHLHKMMKSVEEKSLEVDKKMKLLEEREWVVDLRESELALVSSRIEECNGELESKVRELESVRKSIEECRVELEAKEIELGSVTMKVEECGSDFEKRRGELDKLVSSVSDWAEKLSGKKEELRLVEDLVEKFTRERESLRDGIQVCDEKLELKRSQLSEVEKLFEVRKEEIAEVDKKMKLLLECNWRETEQDPFSGRIEGLELIRQGELDELGRSMSDLTMSNKKESNLVEDLDRLIGEKECLFKAIEDCSQQFELKKSNLSELEKSIEAKREELKFTEDHLVELNLEKKRLESHEKDIQCRLNEEEVKLKAKRKKVRKCSGVIKMMKREFKLLHEHMTEQAQELYTKREQLNLVQQSLEKSNKEPKEKEELILPTEKSLANCSEKLELKKGHLSSVEQSVQEQQFNSIRNSLTQRCQELEESLKEFQESLKDFELKKVQLQKTSEEQPQKLGMQEKQPASMCLQLVKIQQPESLVVNECATMLHPHLKSCTTDDGKVLQLLMNDNMKRDELCLSEISNAVKKAHDPAKLVLDAVDSFFPSLSEGEELGFDVVRNMKSCVLLLERLLSFSPQISPQVKDDALKLAGLWKSKMVEDDSLEVLGFLHLVAAFRLVSDFDGNEVQRLLDIVDPYKQKPELINALKMPDESHERPISPSQVQTEQVEHAMDCTEIKDPSKNCIQDSITEAGGNVDENDLPDEFSAALLVSPDPAKFALDFIKKIYSKNQKRSADMKEGDIRFYILILEQLRLILPKVNPQVKEQATKFAVQWKSNMRVVSENFLMVLFFLLFLATYELGAFFEKKEILTLLFAVIQHKQAPELCRSLGFTTMVPKIILSLTERNQYLEAVRFICTFNLMKQRYLAYIQITSANMYKDGSNCLETKCKALDFVIAALRSLIECVEECKLESSIISNDIKNCIVNLEAHKEISSHSQPMITHLLQGSFVSSASSNQPQQGEINNHTMTHPQFQGQNCNFNTSAQANQSESSLRKNDSSASSPGNQPDQWNSRKRPRSDSYP